jgi:hypothetical protein
MGGKAGRLSILANNCFIVRKITKNNLEVKKIMGYTQGAGHWKTLNCLNSKRFLNFYFKVLSKILEKIQKSLGKILIQCSPPAQNFTSLQK